MIDDTARSRTKILPDSVVRAVHEHFPPASQEQVLSMLGAIEEDDQDRYARIALAVVRLSGGDPALAQEYAERALLDAEMVISRANQMSD